VSPLATFAPGRSLRHHHAISTIFVATGTGPPSYCYPTSSTTWPTADLAIYVPVLVKHRVVVRKLAMAIQVQAGNIDIGVYSASGVRQVSTGTQAASTGGVYDVTDTTIGPGLFYLAGVADTTSTLSVYRAATPAPTCAAAGVLTEQLGAGGALPSTATWAVNQTLAFYPALTMLLEETVA